MKRSLESARVRIGLLVAALGVAASCGGDDGGGTTEPPPPPTPTALAAVSGDGQTAVAGAALASPFVVEVTDQNGDPAADVDVTWAVTEGGGALSTTSSRTNAAGRTSATLTLGPAAGAHRASARSTGLTGSPVTFSATATLPPEPASLEIVSGDGQKGKTKEDLAEPFVVRVLDGEGEGVAGVSVDWTVTSGSGFVIPTSSITNNAGEAVATFTPGNTLGTATIEASVDGLAGSPLTFTAETTVWLVRIISISFVDWNDSNFSTIALGDTIEWVNLDDPAQTGPHTVTSDSSNSQPTGGSQFDMLLPQQGARFRFVPEVAGTWTYHCRIHGAALMSGTLTVQ